MYWLLIYSPLDLGVCVDAKMLNASFVMWS